LLPDPAPLAARLTRAGFLGPPLEGGGDVFVVGERFLQLVTFSGCSVRIELSPTGNVPFCHIRLTGPFPQPVFLSGRNTRPPRCRSCRSPLHGWRQAVSDREQTGPVRIPCPACRETSPPWDYDWKQQAGFGRLFIRVEEVFPGEAVPTPALLALLADTGGIPWRYFYIQDA